MQHGLSSRVVKDHFALHPPWELLPQGEFVEGEGLSVGTETVISLRIKDIISGCVRVGSGPMGGGGRGGARRPWCSVIFPCFDQLAHLIGVSGM